MTLLSKVLKWAYGDSLQYIGFLLATAFLASLAIVFLAYPIQTILSVIAAFVLYTLFTFFHELS